MYNRQKLGLNYVLTYIRSYVSHVSCLYSALISKSDSLFPYFYRERSAPFYSCVIIYVTKTYDLFTQIMSKC